MSEDSTTTARRRNVIRRSECEESAPGQCRVLYSRDAGWAPEVTEAERQRILERQQKYPCEPDRVRINTERE